MYKMIKQCKMDWETEKHSFRFVTGGDRLTALDSLSDFKASIERLYQHILENYDYEEPFPLSFKYGMDGSISGED